MRNEARSLRQMQIEEVAHRLLIEKGYSGTTMLAVAREAGASMETLYNWYGDKPGLFRALITRNAAEVRATLESAVTDGADPMLTLQRFGQELLRMLTSERLVALNRVAVADETGDLGRLIGEFGRGAVAPVLGGLFARAQQRGQLHPDSAAGAAEVYLGLLIGDLQIRRVVARMPAPDEREILRRADRAYAIVLRLWG